MGSFNTTCAISKSPIREGDKVRLFFLVSKAFFNPYFDPKRDSVYADAGCYSHDNFKVIGGISLPATYEDYNTYSFEDTVLSDYILDWIKNNYAENVPVKGVEYNVYHDHMSVKVEDLDWEKVQDMIHSGRLFTKGFGGNYPFVTKMEVHESVYQVMLQDQSTIFVCDDSDDGYHYAPYNFDIALAAALEKHKNTNNTDELNKLYEKNLVVFSDMFDGEDMSEEQKSEEVRKIAMTFSKMELELPSTENDFSHTFVQNQTNIVKEISRYAHENNIEYDEEFVVREDAEGVFFNTVMERYHLMYAPHMTSGQDVELSADALFHQRIAGALNSIPNQWEDDYVNTEKFTKTWQEVNLSDIIAFINDCYDADSEEYTEIIAKIDDYRKQKEHIDIQEFGQEQFADPELKFITDFIYNKTINLELHIHK